jgi:hypothetical protein
VSLPANYDNRSKSLPDENKLTDVFGTVSRIHPLNDRKTITIPKIDIWISIYDVEEQKGEVITYEFFRRYPLVSGPGGQDDRG